MLRLDLLKDRLGTALAAGAVLVSLAGGAQAAHCDLPHPEGKVILTVAGKIGACNHHGEVRLDLHMLEAMPSKMIVTKNPWDRGKVAYQGVLLRDLMAYVKAEGHVASVEALNDYHADIALADMRRQDVILAYKREGVVMTVRDKGPLFVVFPFHASKARMNDPRFSQSVWQVHRIELK